MSVSRYTRINPVNFRLPNLQVPVELLANRLNAEQTSKDNTDKLMALMPKYNNDSYFSDKEEFETYKQSINELEKDLAETAERGDINEYRRKLKTYSRDITSDMKGGLFHALESRKASHDLNLEAAKKKHKKNIEEGNETNYMLQMHNYKKGIKDLGYNSETREYESVSMSEVSNYYDINKLLLDNVKAMSYDKQAKYKVVGNAIINTETNQVDRTLLNEIYIQNPQIARQMGIDAEYKLTQLSDDQKLEQLNIYKQSDLDILDINLGFLDEISKHLNSKNSRKSELAKTVLKERYGNDVFKRTTPNEFIKQQKELLENQKSSVNQKYKDDDPNTLLKSIMVNRAKETFVNSAQLYKPDKVSEQFKSYTLKAKTKAATQAAKDYYTWANSFSNPSSDINIIQSPTNVTGRLDNLYDAQKTAKTVYTESNKSFNGALAKLPDKIKSEINNILGGSNSFDIVNPINQMNSQTPLNTFKEVVILNSTLSEGGKPTENDLNRLGITETQYQELTDLGTNQDVNSSLIPFATQYNQAAQLNDRLTNTVTNLEEDLSKLLTEEEKLNIKKEASRLFRNTYSYNKNRITLEDLYNDIKMREIKNKIKTNPEIVEANKHIFRSIGIDSGDNEFINKPVIIQSLFSKNNEFGMTEFLVSNPNKKGVYETQESLPDGLRPSDFEFHSTLPNYSDDNAVIMRLSAQTDDGRIVYKDANINMNDATFRPFLDYQYGELFKAVQNDIPYAEDKLYALASARSSISEHKVLLSKAEHSRLKGTVMIDTKDKRGVPVSYNSANIVKHESKPYQFTDENNNLRNGNMVLLEYLNSAHQSVLAVAIQPNPDAEEYTIQSFSSDGKFPYAKKQGNVSRMIGFYQSTYDAVTGNYLTTESAKPRNKSIRPNPNADAIEAGKSIILGDSYSD